MSLRAVKYTCLFPVADDDGTRSSEEVGDISDLLLAADPYLFSSGPIPPFGVVNSLLATGRSDRGMGGGAEWEPFVLSTAEFEEFVSYLDSPAGHEKFHIKKPVSIAVVPSEVRTAEDFLVWQVDEALKDPTHHLNSPERKGVLNGERVTFREYWEDSKRQRDERQKEEPE